MMVTDVSEGTGRLDHSGPRRRKARDGAQSEDKSAPPPLTTPGKSGLALNTELFELWNHSRRLDDPPDSLCPPGEYRDLTVSNLRLAVRLVRLAWRPFFSVIAEVNKLRVGMFLFTKLLHGVLPTAR